MDQTVKAKWIAALRNGKYKQTKGVLNDGEGMCCLGVLCDLHNQEKGLEWEFEIRNDAPTRLIDKPVGISEGGCLVPGAEVTKWAGLVESNPVYDDIARYISGNGEEHLTRANLAELNDSGLTFDQIADVINYFH